MVIAPPVPSSATVSKSTTEQRGSRTGLALILFFAFLALGAHTVLGAGTPVSPSTPAQAAAPSVVPSATPATTPSAAPLSPPAPTLENLPAGAAVDFPWLVTQGDGHPVTWPCGPIGYRLVSDGAPAGARELLAEALGRISAVSGLQFREDPSRDGSARTPYSGIEISWVPREDVPQATANPSVIGIGGASSSDAHYSYGYVDIVCDWPGSTKADFGAESVGPVLLHELGHALGLEHTNDPNAIMFPSDHGVSTWTQPERAALRYLQQSCG